MHENQIASEVVDACYKIHTTLGSGLLESAYENVLAHELRKRGLSVACQACLPIIYDGVELEAGFRPDLIVNDKLIVELKSVEKVAPVHQKQLLTYLRLSNRKLGLLVNFGSHLIKDGIFRVVNDL